MKSPDLKKSCAGFSLVETMVVVVLVATMTGASYSAYHAWTKKERVHAATNGFVSHLREAKIRAIEKHLRFVCSISGNTYTIFPDTDEDDVQDAGETALYTVNMDEQCPGVQIQNGFTIRYDSRGVATTFPSDVLNPTITFRDSAGTYHDVTVNPLGSIKVEPTEH